MMQNSKCSVDAWTERYPIDGQFRISRASKTEAEVVVCRISSDERSGYGECVPYLRYGETTESVLDAIGKTAEQLGGDIAHDLLQEALPPGAARNALDCALWDLQAKISGRHVHSLVCRQPPRPVETAFTVSLDTPDAMADAARGVASRPVLKIKLGGKDDIAIMHAVAAAAPRSRIIADANEAWTPDTLPELMREAARVHIALIEQPLPAGHDELLAEIPHPIPICADESVHIADDLDALRDRYDTVNIKLDKTGGLTEALAMARDARAAGLGIMVGCMVAGSISMAPAVLLAGLADIADVDGPLWLSEDVAHGLAYADGVVTPPLPELWG